VVWDLLECSVGWSKDSVVGLGTVQSLDELWVVVKKLGKLGGVLGLGDELVDSLVWLSVLWWLDRNSRDLVVWWAVVRWTVVRRAVVWWTMVRRTIVWWTVVRRTVVTWRTLLWWVWVVGVVVLKDIEGVVGEALEPSLGVESRLAQAVANIGREGKSLVESVLCLTFDGLGGLVNGVGNLVVVLLEAVEDLIFAPGNRLLDLGGAVVGLDGDIVQDLLGRDDNGASQCRQRQNRKVLHG